MDVTRFLNSQLHGRHYRDQVAHIEVIEERGATFDEPDRPLPDALRDALGKVGISSLYTHQATALNAVRSGEHVVVVTGTASGKTLCYNLPVLEKLLEDPRSRALYIFPTKALAQDQLQGLRRLADLLPGVTVAAGTYDGDTPTSARKQLRDRGRVVLTNPDMLHAGILPNHSRWAEFLEHLEFVVVDEVHSYRGLFGANVANVLRRLRRIAEHYGRRPTFILCSATIGNPQELAEGLLGLPVTPIANDGSPRGKKTFLLWNPPHLDEAKVERRSPSTDAHYLLSDLVREGDQTICFVRTRVGAELIYRMTQERLEREGSRLARSIRAYRGGYTAEDRREIERQLFSGELLGVTSTNALELGIDIGSMEACLLVGYPGSIASLWQQAGRAGRGADESLAVLIAHNEPIDQFLMRHPDFVFGRTAEEAVVDAHNPHLQALHLRCAAKELPIGARDVPLFGEYTYAMLDLLEDAGDLRRRGDRWFWSRPESYPASEFSLRLGTDNVCQIVDVTSGTPTTIGEIDQISAYHIVHTEAIYLHQGDTYFVKELNLERRHAYVEKGDYDYYTQAIDRAQIRVEDVEVEADWRVAKVGFGDVDVTEMVIMFRKIKFGSSDSIGFGNLDLPAYSLDTNAMWVIPPRQALEQVREHGRSPQDGLVGIGNVLAAVMPLFTMSDRQDVSVTMDSMNFGSPTIFLYDKYPGGAGFAQRAYGRIEELMTACLELVASCDCDDGCPSCVGASEAEWGRIGDSLQRSTVPDKEAALCILHHLLEREPYVPKPVSGHRPEGAAGGTAPPPDQPGSEPIPAPRDVKRLPAAVENRIRRRLSELGG